MKLKEITIEITQQCPNYCIHCSSMSSLSKNHMMPLEKVKELIDDVDILGCEQISFSGGEPFLHKDLVKMVAYAYRKGMRVAVYTSGIYNDSKGYSAIPTILLWVPKLKAGGYCMKRYSIASEWDWKLKHIQCRCPLIIGRYLIL